MGNLISRVQNLIWKLKKVRMQRAAEAGAARKGSARRTVRDDLKKLQRENTIFYFGATFQQRS